MAMPTKLPSGVRFRGWEITSNKKHILESRCTAPQVCKQGGEQRCDFCRYSAELELPALPEEVYNKNFVKIAHVSSGARVEFNPLDALRLVDAHHDLVKVAYAKDWATARESGPLKSTLLKPKVHKPFDWTFTTKYNGSLLPEQEWTVCDTDEGIDFEALKIREPILFSDVVNLFGDDFGDNGEAHLSARVRVMPSSFFALQRLLVRVDQVLVRVIDTRVYHKFGVQHVIRECTTREQSIPELEKSLGIPKTSARGPGGAPILAEIYKADQINRLVDMLPVLDFRQEKLQLVHP
eukprot:m.294463 g.294463  ORF g.294463 m.294463 type:complete len:294 (+) comp20035_c0_seq8:281-1162(+)